MAETSENWVKQVLEQQEYKIEKHGGEDVFAYKSNLGIVVEDKDWKDPVKVWKNRIYKRGVNGKWYYQKRSQVVQYGYEIKMKHQKARVYRFIVCVYVFSNLVGRRVQPIFFRKFGTIFCVNRRYFPVWLKSLERTYMGQAGIESPTKYMGGK